MKLAALLLTSIGCCGDALGQLPWTREQMAADLDEIAASVSENWAYFESHRDRFGIDIERLRVEAHQELPSVESIDDYAGVIRRFTAGLRDGHAWSSVPGESLPPLRRLPFDLIDGVEGLIVSAIADDTEAPNVGDVLTRVAGREVDEWIAQCEREVNASTPGMRRASAIARAIETSSARVECEFLRRDGSSETLVIDTIRNGARIGKSPPENWSVTWLEDDIAMLHLSSFAVPRWAEWLNAKPEEREPFLREGKARIEAIIDELNAKRTKALMIDLRGNGGGTDALGIHLAERLLDGAFSYFLLSAKSDGAWRQPGGLTYGEGQHARFLGELVLLVDSRSFSTTDNFARCIDDLHPACTIVGRPSGGGTGAPRPLVETTHTKTVVGACSMRVFGPRGAYIEGRGTIPDVLVSWTIEDVMEMRDPDVEAGRNAITK